MTDLMDVSPELTERLILPFWENDLEPFLRSSPCRAGGRKRGVQAGLCGPPVSQLALRSAQLCTGLRFLGGRRKVRGCVQGSPDQPQQPSNLTSSHRHIDEARQGAAFFQAETANLWTAGPGPTQDTSLLCTPLTSSPPGDWKTRWDRAGRIGFLSDNPSLLDGVQVSACSPQAVLQPFGAPWGLGKTGDYSLVLYLEAF